MEQGRKQGGKQKGKGTKESIAGRVGFVLVEGQILAEALLKMREQDRYSMIN